MNAPPGNRGPASLAGRVGGGWLVVWCCLGAAGAEVLDPSKLPPPASGPIDFTADIRPILETTCLRCHGAERPKSRFRLTSRQAALAGGDNGVDIIPGNSGQSRLVYYVARVVPDMEMPPPGKGEALATNQVALLRAWIDQGAAWGTSPATNNFAFSISPTFGGTWVSGNAQKFRELYGVKDGPDGGLERFEMSGNSGPDTKYAVSGHALLADYKLDFSLDKNDLGYVHSGWEEYRKYYSDTGGYFPPYSPLTANPTDLYLDIGKAWIDFGLALPHGPQMKLGYEYDYKQGDEATLNWGVYAAADQRNVAPAIRGMDEAVHVIKFDLEQEIEGGSIQDQFRGEFYNLKTQYTNTDARGGATENAREGNRYFQGANTIRLEKRFNEWVFASGGYLYSKLNSDASFTDSVNSSALLFDSVPQITLEKDSQVMNLNGFLGPFGGLTLTGGVEQEWTRQHGFAGNKAVLNPAYTNGSPAAPDTVNAVPTILSADYDQSTTTESAALRFNKIPYTSLFVEARLQQQTIAQNEDDFQAGSGFGQNTAFSSQLSDFRAGFSTSPWRGVTLSAHYRRYEDDSHYDNNPGLPPSASYPGFMLARFLLRDEAETKLAWHPCSWLKTALSYQYLATQYTTDTDGVGGVTSGGDILAGQDFSRVYSVNSTMTPCPRLYLSGTFAYQPTVSATAINGVPTLVPYRGEIYSVVANGSYALGQKTDLFANYSFSEADYGQNNGAAGLPVGIEYQQQTVAVGLARHLGKNVTAKLRYGYDFYAEPSSGTLNNFTAQSIFCTVTYRMP